MDKKAVRKELIAKRDSIPRPTQKEKSASIKKRLLKLEIFQEAYTILFYVSFGSEVETHQLIKDALQANKRVAIPLVGKDGLLIKQIINFDELNPGTWNILEPSQDAVDIGIEDINLIVVPGVAFTRNHHRLGYGGGYYDKLLNKEDEAGFISVALAFEEQIIADIPVEEHDQKVDFIVTERKII